jgi:hypothetical protein
MPDLCRMILWLPAQWEELRSHLPRLGVVQCRRADSGRASGTGGRHAPVIERGGMAQRVERWCNRRQGFARLDLYLLRTAAGSPVPARCCRMARDDAGRPRHGSVSPPLPCAVPSSNVRSLLCLMRSDGAVGETVASSLRRQLSNPVALGGALRPLAAVDGTPAGCEHPWQTITMLPLS